MTTVFDEWEAGDITDMQALHALLSDLGELESELTPMEGQRKVLKDQISRVVDHLGGKAEAAGMSAQITAPAKVVSYDTKRLDDLVLRLLAVGEAGIAAEISECRQESMRSGSLRISKVR